MVRQLSLLSSLFLLLCVFRAEGPAQVVNASLSGSVADTSGALIPGVEVTALNTGTNVASNTITNESGTYRFPSLQPGTYRVSAELAGFQAQAFQVTLGTSQNIRQNFTLQVGGVAQAVDVSVAADELLTTAAQSVAGVLPQNQVMDLPLVGRNVLDFVRSTAPGVVGNGGAGTTFAGIRAGGSGNVNIQVDGQTVNNGRYEQGITAATNINPDMVEEVRLVVAAVDVEGRGSAQVQIRTRSGTNQFHGGLVWNYRNSALDANSWSNNRLRVDKTWYSKHQYTASLGGPIIRNKTFFFGLFDGQRGLQKASVDALVLTPAARQGIFRFFPGVNNGNADVTPTGTGTTRTAAVVDALGNPLDWTRIPGATGPMQSFSVFGDGLNPGDPFRRRMDPSGFMTQLLRDMPLPNAYNGPATNGGASVDGLNTAIHRWVRRTVGGASGGSGENVDAFNRKQVNIKIDHHFNQAHRLSGSWSREHRYSDNNELSPWPNGFGGEAVTDPSVLTLQFTSVLSPAVLNEFRFGRTVTALHYVPSYHHSKHGEEAFQYMPVINDIPVLLHPKLFELNMLGCQNYCADIGHSSPLTVVTNTLSWTSGSHAMKFGGEVRRANSRGWSSNVLVPHVYGGAGDIPVRGIDTIAGLLPGNQTLAQDILLSLSGSVNDTRERFEIREPGDTAFVDYRTTYNNPSNPAGTHGKINDWHQNEFNFFIKDDWRVTPTFTLNLGIRYDLMQVPYLLSATGRNYTPGLLGGNAAAFGYSGRSYDDWMSGGGPQKGDLTKTVLIGKDTNYPDEGLWKSDRNNWAPALGFAWSPALWGRDKTTIRGGYQIAYQLPGGSLSWVNVDRANTPGFIYEPTDLGDGTFRDFSNIAIPLPVRQKPFEAVPLTQRTQTLRGHDENYATPYVQTFTLGVTRALASNITLDVKYVGTRGIKLHGIFNVNTPDFRNNGLYDALQITRAGGDAPLFDRMLRGLNIGGVVGTQISGSEALRRHASTRTAIANGNYLTVAEWLNTTNTGTVQPPLTAGGLLRSSGTFPENFIVANPQFGPILLRRNMDNSEYHSLQSQVTLRPTNGVSYQATYTWSKNLGVFSSGNYGYRDPLNAFADYSLETNNRAHSFRSYGTFELPFGPGKWIGGNTSGVLARLIEGWQLGSIVNLTSGAPMNISSGTTLYMSGTPDLAGDFPRSGKVAWNAGETFGNYFGQQYQRVQDPQCRALASSLTQWCTINALADASGKIVLQTAAPGQFGALGLATIGGPGSWDFDLNMQKTIRVNESKRVTVRMDARNVLNHPTPGNPNLNMNSGTFGQITTKTGNRTVQGQLRFDF
jgi:hypothetical protein